MASGKGYTIGRRDLLTRTVPACAMAWLGLCKLQSVGICDGAPQQEGQRQQGQHKFDIPKELTLSERQQSERQNQAFIHFIKTLHEELGEPELIRLLNMNSAVRGRRIGEMQAQRATETSLQAFVSQFRPPRYSSILTHEVVEDTEKAFELRVTECLIAEVFQAAGLGGAIGHAAVCNMDYYWPTAFNPNLKMERNRTLMQGHDHCNHRYIDTAWAHAQRKGRSGQAWESGAASSKPLRFFIELTGDGVSIRRKAFQRLRRIQTHFPVLVA